MPTNRSAEIESSRSQMVVNTSGCSANSLGTATASLLTGAYPTGATGFHSSWARRQNSASCTVNAHTANTHAHTARLDHAQIMSTLDAQWHFGIKLSRSMCRLAGWFVGCWLAAGWLAAGCWPAGWLAAGLLGGWLEGCSAGWLAGWLGWLVGRLAAS